jgi:AraC-like DNA-binding protein
MEQAVRERVGLYHGLEFPVECYSIHSRGDVKKKAAPPHYHEYIEFLYASGDCDVSVWIAGETVDFKSGDLIVISSNTPHSFMPRLAVNEYICIKALPKMLCFSENSFFDVKYVTPFTENSLKRFQLFRADEVDGTSVPSYFKEALTEWKGKEYGYEVSLKSLIFRIFLWTIRKNHSKGDDICALERENSVENICLIQRATELIGENYATLTESEAAESVGMSYSHFSRLFKRIMGKSFKEYLTATRINAAERMLFETDVPITEVALACGFATSSHFIDRFKRVKGVTPKQYRRIFIEN